MKSDATHIDQWEEASDSGGSDSGCGSDCYYVEQRRRSSVVGLVRRSVPQIPAHLQSLAMEAVLQQLVSLCTQSNYAINKRALKHYLKFQLPVELRQQLLDLALRDGRIYTLVDLNVFELLLSPSVKEVNIRSIRPFFRQPLVTMLRQLGTGIEGLILHDSSWLDASRNSLPFALAAMTQLQELSLHYFANDAMVAAVAKNCPELQILDLTSSTSVTDKGMQLLCNPEGKLPPIDPECGCDDGEIKISSGRHRKLSAPAQIAHIAAGSMVRMVRTFRRHSIIQNGFVGSSTNSSSFLSRSSITPVGEEEMDEELPELDEYSSTGSLRSLRRITVTGTQVSDRGVRLLLRSSAHVTILS